MNGSTAGLGGEEAGLDGDDAERQRRLDSFTLHRRRLQRWPGSSRMRRRTLAELGRFRGREEERRAGVLCSGGVVVCGIEGAYL
jgi:hypothetical protein